MAIAIATWTAITGEQEACRGMWPAAWAGGRPGGGRWPTQPPPEPVAVAAAWQGRHLQLPQPPPGHAGQPRCEPWLAGVYSVNQYKYSEESEPNSMFSFINQTVGNTAFELTSSG